MMISREEIRRRQNKLREYMSEKGVGALVTGASAQLGFRGVLRYLIDYYLPVFEEYLVIPVDGPVTLFVHDPCGADYAAKHCAVDDIRIIPGDEYNDAPGKCAAEFVKGLKAARVSFAGMTGLSANFFLSFWRHMGLEQQFDDLTPVLNKMRMVKSPAEIVLTEKAVELNEKVFHHYLRYVKPDGRELEAVNEASLFAMRNGAEDLYWMASSGETPYLSFLSEARHREHTWRHGDYHYITLEHSAEGGHFGEITHLISLGDPKPEYVEAFAAVSEAQKAAAAAIKPGTTVGEIAEASDYILAQAGYVKQDAACRAKPAGAIGHSQGTDVWEFPRIVQGCETIIEPGMRFNLHPAITLPDGAKITSCDCWISTNSGARRLSTLPYSIITI